MNFKPGDIVRCVYKGNRPNSFRRHELYLQIATEGCRYKVEAVTKNSFGDPLLKFEGVEHPHGPTIRWLGEYFELVRSKIDRSFMLGAIDQ